jgi:hypothetical protein
LYSYGILVYRPNHKITPEEALIEFFGLTGKQFCFCFVPYMKTGNTDFKSLNATSKPKEVAYNIYTLVGSVSPFQKRMVLVEKFIK